MLGWLNACSCCRTLSWGGATLDTQQLQERALRITGQQMDELSDGALQPEEPQTSLQNALLVRLPHPAQDMAQMHCKSGARAAQRAPCTPAELPLCLGLPPKTCTADAWLRRVPASGMAAQLTAGVAYKRAFLCSSSQCYWESLACVPDGSEGL